MNLIIINKTNSIPSLKTQSKSPLSIECALAPPAVLPPAPLEPGRLVGVQKQVKLRAKIVTFDNVLIIYYFKDYEHEDRKGYWIENRCHFQRHCNRIQEIISFIFQDAHRDKIQKLIHKWAILDSSTSGAERAASQRRRREGQLPAKLGSPGRTSFQVARAELRFVLSLILLLKKL